MKSINTLLFLLFSCSILAQQNQDYWQITNRNSIVWDLTKESRLPHEENIEMSGKNVSAIVYYDIDKDRNLTLKRDVIFPQLRIYNKTNEPDWKKYRAYFRRTVEDDVSPKITYNNKIIIPSKVDSVEIGGMLKFYHSPIDDLLIIRTLYPSMEGRFLTETWEIKNIGADKKDILIANCEMTQAENGYKGIYRFHAFSDSKTMLSLNKNETYTIPIYFGATMNTEKIDDFGYRKAWQQRQDYLNEMQQKLTLKTPSNIINTLFYFSKIRASESIFNSSMGLVHSPGGGNYYVGIWANDQVEYSGPFFPYLGYETGNIAAANTYKMFQKNIPEDGKHIAYAFEVDGNFPMEHLDRGDAAMIAYGTSHFALAKGDKAMAKEFWKLIEWSLEYCHNHRNDAGAVISESDEMEGRVETGTANLATSALYYGGLKYSVRLAKDLGFEKKAVEYEKRQKAMENVIENYFGATMEGFETYKYFDENQFLRHWICLPLSVGIDTRKEGTIDALFSKMWTENGVLVQYKPGENIENTMFWDRATLYALQGAMKVGATDLTYERLLNYSQKRLLGNHVPYVVEAYPENNMKHLSAESALYCRILTEGMLGIEPMSLNSFKLKPTLPSDWDFLVLKNLNIGGQTSSIYISRKGKKLKVKVTTNGKTLYDGKVKQGESILVKFD